MISVIILTKNEEKDLPRCLQSVSWSSDVHVLDSGSTDKTVEQAFSYGAQVSTNNFESFAQQRNFALENLQIRNDWILFLDADEVVTDAFLSAMEAAISSADDSTAGFYCCWKMMLENTWLKRSDNFPKWQFRLMRKGRARFRNFGHGQKEGDVQGVIRYLNEPYLHYGFSKGWSHWIERHNKYSSQEALARLHFCPPLKNVFSAHSSVRNPAIKSWMSKLPGWPLIRFFFTYFIRFGFVEGMPALIYCTNICYYEFLIQIKMRELVMEERELGKSTLLPPSFAGEKASD